MKVLNKGVDVVNLVLSQGPVSLKKGDTVEMPEWVFKSLKRIFPGLTPVEAVIEAEPAPIVTPEPEPKPAKKPVAKKRK
jgi:hypothetical protein